MILTPGSMKKLEELAINLGYDYVGPMLDAIAQGHITFKRPTAPWSSTDLIEVGEEPGTSEDSGMYTRGAPVGNGVYAAFDLMRNEIVVYDSAISTTVHISKDLWDKLCPLATLFD